MSAVGTEVILGKQNKYHKCQDISVSSKKNEHNILDEKKYNYDYLPVCHQYASCSMQREAECQNVFGLLSRKHVIIR